MSPPAEGKPSHPDVVLGICCLSVLLMSMDVTVVNVALPAIQHELHATLVGLQWVVDAYTLVIASLLILAGSMADRFGRRRVFQLGMITFTVGSLLCSLAPSTGGLIACRVVQALGASMLNPVALSIIANTFPEPKARARVIGVWGAVAGLALATGPVVGGVLVQSLGWRSVFWVNLPVGVAAIFLTARFVRESKAAQARRLDPVGQTLVLIGLGALTSAVIEGPREGWGSAAIVALFAAAALAAGALLVYEPRRTDPLLDLRFFRSVPFSSATVVAVCSFAAFSGFLFLNTLYLQQGRGLSAFHTGLCTLPLAVLMGVGGPVSGRLVGRYGARPSLLLAGAAIVVSALALTQLADDSALGLLLSTYGLFGLGMGVVNPPIANTAIAGMPKAQAGVAAAIASTSRQVGAALGVAVAGTVAGVTRGYGVSLAQATHPVWWLMAGCGVMVLALGWASTTPWAQASARHTAHLLEEPR